VCVRGGVVRMRERGMRLRILRFRPRAILAPPVIPARSAPTDCIAASTCDPDACVAGNPKACNKACDATPALPTALLAHTIPTRAVGPRRIPPTLLPAPWAMSASTPPATPLPPFRAAKTKPVEWGEAHLEGTGSNVMNVTCFSASTCPRPNPLAGQGTSSSE
jgi:hypothetical protein